MEQQIKDIKQHESKLMEKTFEFTSKLAGIEEGMHRLHEHVQASEQRTDERVNALETRLNSRIDTMEHNLFSAISSHVEIVHKLKMYIVMVNKKRLIKF